MNTQTYASGTVVEYCSLNFVNVCINTGLSIGDILLRTFSLLCSPLLADSSLEVLRLVEDLLISASADRLLNEGCAMGLSQQSHTEERISLIDLLRGRSLLEQPLDSPTQRVPICLFDSERTNSRNKVS